MKQEKISVELSTEEKIQKYEEYLNSEEKESYATLKKIPLLNASEEVEFCERAQLGDRKYLEYTMIANFRLVNKIASLYFVNKNISKHCYEEEDFIQEGRIGLKKAIEKFDKEKGTRFSTYATWWIKQCILRSMADSAHPIRYPVYMWGKINRLRSVLDELSKEPHYSMNIKEIAEKMGISESEVIDIKHKLDTNVVSLDKTIPTDDLECSLIDFIENTNSINPEDEIVEKLYFQEINSVFSQLSEREKFVLTLRYGFTSPEEKSFPEIGERLGLSKQRAKQIEEKAIEKFRKVLIQKEADILREILNQFSETERYIFELRYGLNNCKVRSVKKVEKETGVKEDDIRIIEEKVLGKFAKYCFEHMS